MGDGADDAYERGLCEMLDDREGLWGADGADYYAGRSRRTFTRWPKQPVTCRYCRKANLRWGKVHNRKTEYQLEEKDGSMHVCDFSDTMPNLDA